MHKHTEGYYKYVVFYDYETKKCRIQKAEGRIMNAQRTMFFVGEDIIIPKIYTKHPFYPNQLYACRRLPAVARLRQHSTLFSKKLCNNVKTQMKNSANIIAFSLLKNLAKYGIIFLQLAIIAKK